MSSHDGAYFLALCSAILFSGASVVFARFSVSHSSLWMNVVKNFVATLAFAVAAILSVIFTNERWSDTGAESAILFIVSGVVGLALGDYFLFRGYQRLGSARTIMIFSFSPIFLTLEGFIFFGQGLKLHQAIALLLMMACAWTLSFEKFKSHGAWEWKGIGFALLGVFLDNVGVVLSRMAFDESPGTSAFTANLIRSAGALVPLLWAQWYFRERAFQRFLQIPRSEKLAVSMAAFFGTFVSLTLWLTALKIGHIGSLAGVGSFNPVAASLWEWILLKKRPTPYLLVAFGLFLAGFAILLFGGISHG